MVLSLLAAPLFIFFLVSVWGVVRILSVTLENGSVLLTLASIVNALIPVLLALSVLAVPVGIVFAIYFYLRRNEN